MDRAEAAGFVAKALSGLTRPQMKRVVEFGKKNKFHHGARWFGPEEGTSDPRFSAMGGCAVAVAFQMKPDATKRGWWGARVDRNSLAGYEYLLSKTGGDAGCELYTEAMRAIDSDDIVSALSKKLSAKTKSAKRKRSA